MEFAANRVVKIVSDLKISPGKANLAEKTLLNINHRPVANRRCASARATLSKAGIRIRLELADALPDIEGNLQNIEQIALNILINAAQAIEHAHGEIKIQTGLNVKDGRVHLRISTTAARFSGHRGSDFPAFVSDKTVPGRDRPRSFRELQPGQGSRGEISFESRLVRWHESSRCGCPPCCTASRQILVVDDGWHGAQVLMEALALPRAYRLEEAANELRRSIGSERTARSADFGCVHAGNGRRGGMPPHQGRAGAGGHESSSSRPGSPTIPKLAELAELGFSNVLAKPFDIPLLLRLVRTLLEL